ncbi:MULTISPECIES: restriction endonuclease subunit S [Citrobacter]|uniref:restriction endonuclease subunit S n=1 Tax=Citrobacter meridianamericanus TaxID=2894201 RepID=UPI00397A467A
MSTEQVEVLGKYQPYPEYKDSGVEWLGEVPQHWQTGRLGSFGYFISGCGFPHEYQGSQDGLYPFYKVSDTNNDGNEKYLSKAENYVSKEVASKLGARICSAGGIMFPKVGAALLGNKRRILTLPSITDNNTMVYFSYEGNSSYWYYWLSQLDFGQLSNPGPVPSINESQLKDFVAICPTQYEQRTIAAFLDYETARIDKLIAQHQRLIELLKEKRQAVISHAVTKGLNPDAPMKDSGVEWLGEVPEHWVVTLLRYFITTRKGVAFKAQDFCDDGVAVVKASDIKEFSFKGASTSLPAIFLSEYPKAILRSGNIVLSTVGSTPDVKNSAVGQLGMLPEELDGALLNQNTVVFEANSIMCDNDFLFLILQTQGYRDHLDLHAHGTANQASLNVTDMLNFSLPLPPLKEQRCIVDLVRGKLDKLNRLEQLGIEAQKKYQERRTALISAAVTGKIDLRGWTAPVQEGAA